MGVVDPFSVARAAGLELVRTSEGLTLTDGTMELRADFGRMLPRLKQGRLQQELLVKVARTKGVERPWAIDATAGFGEDSLLLAAAGFAVDLYEQDCVIAALLRMLWIARQMIRRLRQPWRACAYMRARTALPAFAIQLS